MRWLIPLFGLLLLLGACATPSPTATPALASPTPTTAPIQTPVATPLPANLTVWLPDWMLLSNPDATAALQAAIADFEERNQITVQLVAKAPRGEGGLYDFLTNTQAVAPAALPDMIALPFADAQLAAEEGLLQPLDGLLDPTLFDELFPFAREQALAGADKRIAPFSAEFEHLAYRPTALSEPPLAWSTLIDAGAAYAFPAASVDPQTSSAVFLHYLSTLPEGAEPARDPDALRRLLDFYDEGRRSSAIAPQSAQAVQPGDTWALGLQGSVPLADTTSSLWLSDSNQTTTLRFGPIPTADAAPRFLANGWAYSIVTADPARQALAADLLTTLLQPETLAAWTLAAHTLPASAAALSQWPASDYTLFAQDALNAATTLPPLAEDAAFMRALQRAVVDVLTGVADPQTATATAEQSW